VLVERLEARRDGGGTRGGPREGVAEEASIDSRGGPRGGVVEEASIDSRGGP